MQGFWQNYVATLLVAGGLLYGLYLGARRLAHRRTFSQSQALLAVLVAVYVSPNTTISVVRAGSRYLLVGGGSGRLQTLAELSPNEVNGWIGGRDPAMATRKAAKQLI